MRYDGIKSAKVRYGRLQARPYGFYLESPDYDQVRAKVAGTLDGNAQPLNGSADPLWAGEPMK